MQLEERGLIFDATIRPAGEKANAFTSLLRLESGAILAAFQCGPVKHGPTSTVKLFRSLDSGSTWQEIPFKFDTSFNGVPGSLSSADLVETSPGKLLLFSTWFDRSDPEKPLYDPVSQGILHCKQLYCASSDGGETWGPWQVLPTPGLTGCATTGSPLRWSDGTIGYPFESFKEYDDPTPGRHAAWLAISRDGGKTWPEFHLVAQHPEHKVYYWDQRLCVGRDPGEYYAMFWTHDLDRKEDLLVHFKHGNINEKAVGAITETTIEGQIATPLLLDDGRLVSFVVDRHRPGSLKLWCSSDGGKTWPEKDCLPIHIQDEKALLSQGLTNIDFDQYWEDMAKWTYGHPAIRSIGNGRVLAAFYAGVPGTLNVHWARVKV